MFLAIVLPLHSGLYTLATIATIRYTLVRKSVENKTLSSKTLTCIIAFVCALYTTQLTSAIGYHFYHNLPFSVFLELCLGRTDIRVFSAGTLFSYFVPAVILNSISITMDILTTKFIRRNTIQIQSRNANKFRTSSSFNERKVLVSDSITETAQQAKTSNRKCKKYIHKKSSFNAENLPKVNNEKSFASFKHKTLELNFSLTQKLSLSMPNILESFETPSLSRHKVVLNLAGNEKIELSSTTKRKIGLKSTRSSVRIMLNRLDRASSLQQQQQQQLNSQNESETNGSSLLSTTIVCRVNDPCKIPIRATMFSSLVMVAYLVLASVISLIFNDIVNKTILATFVACVITILRSSLTSLAIFKSKP